MEVLKRNVELSHNPVCLPHRCRVRVNNIHAALERLYAVVDSRHHRGMRLRIVPDYSLDVIELGARHLTQLNMGVRELQNAGYFREFATWKINPLVKKRR